MAEGLKSRPLVMKKDYTRVLGNNLTKIRRRFNVTKKALTLITLQTSKNGCMPNQISTIEISVY